ncbi:MAG: Gfo/Idh/MocA family oxidoreductase [Anaerolineae bacterium]|nr:Gfo/Idh/MocA family oxidoreductase [Anaerolineae bacterium]
MAAKTRWGIIGTGNIARQFARGLAALSEAELVAVGSRSQETADTFGDLFHVPHRHASYEAVAEDSAVDAVYIGTPHSFHRDNSLLCLSHGKAVLTEKPFAINAQQAQEVVDFARAHKIFLMEAMWTRFLPIFVRMRELLAAQTIGEVRMLTADFGFRTHFNPEGRLFNPALGGGALLDVGIYPLSLASMVFGPPERITSMAHRGETGVDENTAIILGYEGGALASLTTAVRTNTPQVATLNGTEGRITVHSRWWIPTRMTVEIYGKETAEIEMPFVGNGYNYEAAEVGRGLREGLLESDVMPLDETLSIMRTMDTIRAQWGQKYPME